MSQAYSLQYSVFLRLTASGSQTSFIVEHRLLL